MLGKVFKSRYEIMEKIGEGGMATVYKARCLLLNRIVTVKFLRDQFAHDESFVERFRREAQAAASLSHPNVISIYDVGEENGTYYIVMEYIEGGTLKQVIKDHAPLPVNQAVLITKQICEALVHAHANNIIHRDIKPHNILMSRSGKFKVTDFGIARAVTSNTLTQSGMVIGSAHYLSPEQARGGEVGFQSDIYSLGIIMYEMLTGKLPFDGDNPITIAFKHINDEPVPPSHYNPEIPRELERIIMKAMDKSMLKRYQSSEELLADLKFFLGETDDYNLSQFRRNQATQVMPVVHRKERDDEEIKKPKKPGWKLWTGIGVLIIGLLAFAAWYVPKLLFPPGDIEVPELVGEKIDIARQMLQDRGLRMVVRNSVYSVDIEADHIVAQDPTPFRKVKKNRVIFVDVSKGPRMVGVPDLKDKTLREVSIALADAGLVIGEQTEVFSVDVPAGQVVDQNPRPNIQVAEQSTVDLYISKGPEPVPVTVADFVGNDINAVKGQIASLKLKVGKITQVEDPTLADGTVIAQDPAPDTQVNENSPINLTVVASTPSTTPNENTNANTVEEGTTSTNGTNQ